MKRSTIENAGGRDAMTVRATSVHVRCMLESILCVHAFASMGGATDEDLTREMVECVTNDRYRSDWYEFLY